ncbi:MAG: hypothetical protein HY244_16665 [Rhizobiales bacterium]|nr:hypothetical protein [Hyphomicrobiales bacterium]
MKITPYLLSCGLLLAAPTLTWAKPAYVGSTVNLRAAPGTTSEILAKIPGGSLVDAGECSEGWCAVTWQDKSGFAIQSSLDMSGRVPAQRSAGPSGQMLPGPSYRGRVYSNAPAYADEPVYVEPPAVYYEPGPYYGGYYGPFYRRYWGWRRW